MNQEYKELEIIKSKDLSKKYTAIIQDNKFTKYYVDFGDITKPHYRDTTKLKLYSRLDTNNDHTKFLFNKAISDRGIYVKKFSSLYFMMKYLFS